MNLRRLIDRYYVSDKTVNLCEIAYQFNKLVVVTFFIFGIAYRASHLSTPFSWMCVTWH